MNNVLFITGIDTDIGKTVATGWWARQLAASGKRVITQKLIQTGTPAGEIAADIREHRCLQGIDLTEEDKAGLTAPCVYPYPCSPHLAAKMAERPIDFAAIDEATATLACRYDWVLLEGAGGLCVPLTDELTTLEFTQQRHYPVLIVSSGRLGSLNHTLLTLQACATAKIPVMTLIYNRFGEADPIIARDSAEYLRRYLARNHPMTAFLELPDLSGDLLIEC